MKSSKTTDEAWWRPALKLFAQLSGWIVAPIIIGIYLGRYLDERYQTAPWLFLGCVGVAFVITNIGIVREAKRAMSEIKQLDKTENKNKYVINK